MKPNDKDARTKFSECSKIVKRIAFEKAIAVEEKPVSETIDLDSLSKYFSELCVLLNKWIYIFFCECSLTQF